MSQLQNENIKFSTAYLIIPGKISRISFRSIEISFLKKCQRVYLLYGKYNIKLKSNLAVNPVTDRHIVRSY